MDDPSLSGAEPSELLAGGVGVKGWVLLLAIALVSLVPGKGSDRPLEAHEIFVARTATEVMRSGDWISPTFNGELRFEKPPMNYWLAIGAHRLLGGGPEEAIGEWAARGPSILAGLLLVGGVGRLAWLVTLNRRAAWLAGALFATSQGVVTYAHNAAPPQLEFEF